MSRAMGILGFAGLMLVQLASGTVLLTQEQALKQMFPDADNVVRVARLLTPDQAAES